MPKSGKLDGLGNESELVRAKMSAGDNVSLPLLCTCPPRKKREKRSSTSNYRVKLPKDYKKMLLNAADPLNDRSESDLKMLLLKGILINSGKTWFSLNMNGHHCEMISIAACLTSSESQHYISSPGYTERFAAGCYEPCGAKFKAHVRTQFLLPQIAYTVNLVFKRNMSREQYIGLEYKLEGEEDKSYTFLSDEREDGWLTAELYQFTSDNITIDLEIMFYTKWCSNILVESIEFRPLEKVEHEVLTDDKVDMRTIPDTDTYWEQKLPIDYEDIIKWSVNGVRWGTKRELYDILCEGILISSGEKWFSLAKDGKKCLMLPAKAVLDKTEWKWNYKPDTRFGQLADCISKEFGIFCEFSSKMLSPETTYASYLVYSRLPHGYKPINPPLQVVDKDLESEEEYNIFLRPPQTPLIIGGNSKIKRARRYNPSIRPMIKGLPKLRSDGWMEVQVHEFQTPVDIKMISTRLQLSSYDMSLVGTTVQGLEFRPI
ncbi:hypothetical protein E3N88_27155 [Mikania micrantha]|uniref:Phloem protein 2-like protein n=1 Tax=Mikania micrantha TaxID=192012 RepID=A0A5N6MXF9_9ASTR|nr:hypothetical protein E3N88_27155 [Mikania micrantha]